jgi:hypothetical protein
MDCKVKGKQVREQVREQESKGRVLERKKGLYRSEDVPLLLA